MVAGVGIGIKDKHMNHTMSAYWAQFLSCWNKTKLALFHSFKSLNASIEFRCLDLLDLYIPTEQPFS